MMKKKNYIVPAFKVVKLQPARMLMISGDTVSMPWSGDLPGTAGPEEIDDYSTFDSF